MLYDPDLAIEFVAETLEVSQDSSGDRPTGTAGEERGDPSSGAYYKREDGCDRE